MPLSMPVGKFPSVFQAEIHDIVETIAQFHLDRRYKNRGIAIPSNSQATIKALSSHVVTSKMVWNCRIKLNEPSKQNVPLLWILNNSGYLPHHLSIPNLAKGMRRSLQQESARNTQWFSDGLLWTPEATDENWFKYESYSRVCNEKEETPLHLLLESEAL